MNVQGTHFIVASCDQFRAVLDIIIIWHCDEQDVEHQAQQVHEDEHDENFRRCVCKLAVCSSFAMR